MSRSTPGATVRRALAVAALAVGLVLSAGPALAASPAPTITEPTVPEPVAQYFASGLIPRVADLYGPGKKAGSGITFDSTAQVGSIHRVFVWTADYLSGSPTDSPLQLTNDWVAPVSVRNQVIGLATVWINPSSDAPELATFDPGPSLSAAIATAPKGFVLVRDADHEAWFATDGVTLQPLVSGTSGLATETTIAAYQGNLPHQAPVTPATGATGNQGLIIAGLVLGVVVVLLVVFVLMPDRRKRAEKDAEAETPQGAEDALPQPSLQGAEPIPAPPAATKPAAGAAAATQAAATPARTKSTTSRSRAVTPAAESATPAKPQPAAKAPAAKASAAQSPAAKAPAAKPSAAQAPAAKSSAKKAPAAKSAAVTPATDRPVATPKSPRTPRPPQPR